MSEFGASNRCVLRSFVHFRLLRMQLPRGCRQATHAQQVVSGGNDIGVQTNARQAASHGAAQPAVGLHPAEDLLDTSVVIAADVVHSCLSRYSVSVGRGVDFVFTGGFLTEKKRRCIISLRP